MVQFVEWAIVNSLTVLVLAPVVWGVGRLAPWPSVRHTLWLVLLLKLLTPPLVDVPVDGWLAGLTWPATSATATVAVPLPATDVAYSQAVPVRREPTPVPTIAQADVLPHSTTVLPTDRPRAIPTLQPVPALVEPEAAAAPNHEVWRTALQTGLGLWLLGSLLFFVVQLVRLVRFARGLRRFSMPCEQLTAETAAIARQLGLKHSPPARLVDGVVSPMLWGVGRSTRVLFPADLFEQLDREARGTLLMHELAHYRRGDHWVRVLEFAATTLCWWHPVVWWALREIESAEEDCCDSWVMHHTTSSPRCYAAALLDTIDFLCERHPIAPPISSGLGNPTELRGRLVRIMTGTARATLSPVGRVVVWSLIAVLPLQPAALANYAASIGGLLRVSDELTAPSIVDEVQTASISSRAQPTRTKPAASIARDARQPSGTSPRRSKEWARALSADSRFQILARTGRRVELQDARRSRTVDLTEWNIAAVAFVPGTTQFVTGGYDRQVRLWDADAGRPLRTLGEHPETIVSVAVSADGRTLVSGSQDGTVARWILDGVADRQTLRLDAPVSCVRFAPDGLAVVVATGNWRSVQSGGVTRIDASSWQVLDRTALPAPIGALAYIEDGRVLAAGAWDGTVHYLNADDHELLLSAIASKDAISEAQFAVETHGFPALSALSLAEARSQIGRAAPQPAPSLELGGFPSAGPFAPTQPVRVLEPNEQLARPAVPPRPSSGGVK
jgi:bla regulator protein BlaR1